MQCRQCGFDAGASSVFCPRCGARLSEPGAVTGVTGVGSPDVTRLPGSVASRGPTSESGVSLDPGTSFGTRYRILRRLGQGGMGVVYQAWDEELGIAVALKVIRPEVLADSDHAAEVERRFKRELVTARQVTHKHVVRIHDLGEVGGIKYLTMPFIEGSDLATILKREGALPVARVLHLIRQLASGLAAAHEVGVIHRDLKPENVMVDAGDTAVIMDFGLARSSQGSSVTGTGAVMGTLHYMAPEQAQGQPVDQRADVYALGLVIYDMLAGRRRFGQHKDAMSEMLSRMQTAPPALTAIEPRVPQALGAIVARAIEPDREKRFQSVRELLDALETLDHEGNAKQPLPPAPSPEAVQPRSRAWPFVAAALALVLVVAFGVWWWRSQGTTSGPTTAEAREPVSVLIANFDNRTGDPVFDGSLEQALSLGIEGASFITAYPRRDAERAAQQIRPDATLDEATVRLVCQREGIKTALAGSIAPAGQGYQVSVWLIDPVPGVELARMSETVPGKDQVLVAVSALSAEVRKALGDATPASAMAAARETFTASSLEAARDYAEAQTLANANRDEEAITFYQRALEKDPNLGRAYSGWAQSVLKLGRRDEAEQLYQRAFAQIDRMTEREKLRTLGIYYVNIAANYERAIETNEALVAKYPADGAGHNNLALAYFNQLQFAKALQQGSNLLLIYPKSSLYRYNQALYAMYAGEFAAASTEGRRALDINPNLHKAHLAIAMAALADGQLDVASAEYERARGTGARGISLATMGLADLAMYQGQFDKAVPLLDAGISEDEASRNTAGAAAKAIALAEAHLATRQLPKALSAVERALKIGRDAAVLVPAARVLIDAGREAEAAKLAEQLDVLARRSRAHARLVRAMVLLHRNQPVQAIDELRDAQKLAELWLIRFYQGVAYVEARAYAEALTELESAQKRRGEATAVFLDDVPSYRYMVPVSYWLGRAHEGLGARDAAMRHYRAYLELRSPATDPLAKDAASRMKAP